MEDEGTDVVYSCLLCTEFSDCVLKLDGLYEVPLFVASSSVRIG